MITASELERELANLGHLARRLMPPLNQRPHLFHESKSELIGATQRLLDRVRGVAPPDRSFRARQVDTGLAAVRSGGRAIPIERRTPSAGSFVPPPASSGIKWKPSSTPSSKGTAV